jgi:hypothetical protein
MCGILDVIHGILALIRSRVGNAQSKVLNSGTEIQIDFWNRHLQKKLWGFSLEIKELSCKCLFSVMRYLMYFMLLVHMTFIRKPFLL